LQPCPAPSVVVVMDNRQLDLDGLVPVCHGGA
jgi:hypothetical protein